MTVSKKIRNLRGETRLEEDERKRLMRYIFYGGKEISIKFISNRLILDIEIKINKFVRLFKPKNTPYSMVLTGEERMKINQNKDAIMRKYFEEQR